MYQLLESRKRIKVGKLREPVLCREVRLNVRYAVLPKEQCAEAGLEGEVAELCDVVVREVNCVVVLRMVLVIVTACGLFWRLTRAAPMFSMAEIL
jgi:hypothetical protein